MYAAAKKFQRNRISELQGVWKKLTAGGEPRFTTTSRESSLAPRAQTALLYEDTSAPLNNSPARLMNILETEKCARSSLVGAARERAAICYRNHLPPPTLLLFLFPADLCVTRRILRIARSLQLFIRISTCRLYSSSRRPRARRYLRRWLYFPSLLQEYLVSIAFAPVLPQESYNARRYRANSHKAQAFPADIDSINWIVLSGGMNLTTI